MAPPTIAFDRKEPKQIHDLLHHAHRQHRAITDALENGQGARAEALLKAVTVTEVAEVMIAFL